MHHKLMGLILMIVASAGGASNVVFGPGDANFYVHVNLLEMRQTESGQRMHDWLEKEVFSDLEEEFGMPLHQDIDAVTVFGAAGHENGAVVLHGFIPDAARETLFKRAGDELTITQKSTMGLTYWHLDDLDDNDHDHGHKGDGVFFLLSDTGQNLITTNEEIMQQFIGAGARFDSPAPEGLIVLRADHTLVQAGVDDAFAGNANWDSHFFRNIRRAGIVIADVNGMFNVRAEVETATPEMAIALKNIVEGAVSLRVLSDEQPEAAALLDQLVIETVDQVMLMELTVDPEDLLRVID